MQKIKFIIIFFLITSCNQNNKGEWDVELIPVMMEDKWGYIDTKGKVIIKPEFEFAYHFSDGLAKVGNGNAYGFINKKGEYVIQPGTNSYGGPYFSEGLIKGSSPNGNRYSTSYYTKEGELYKTFENIEAGSFHNGLAKCQYIYETSSGNTRSPFGYMDKHGKLIIDTIFSKANDFSEGLAAVVPKTNDDGKFGYINTTGKVIIDFIYPYGAIDGAEFKDGYARVNWERTGYNQFNYTYIDKHGKEFTDIPYTIEYQIKNKNFSINSEDPIIAHKRFRFGIAPVQIRFTKSEYLWGFVDESGKWIIKPVYKQIDTDWESQL